MPQAARIGDRISHAGAPVGNVGPAPAVLPPPAAGRVVVPPIGVPSVRICGQAAAVAGTACFCPGPPHPPALPVPNVILPSPPSPPRIRGQVVIGGFPAARVGDMTTCSATIGIGVGMAAVGGAPTVWIGGRP